MRHRSAPLLPLLYCALLAHAVTAPAPAAAAEDAGSWFAQRITAGDTPLRIEYFWSDGRKLRMQTVIRGQPLVTLVGGESYSVVDPVQRRGIRVRRARAALQLERQERAKRPFGNEADLFLAAGAEKVGEELVGGTNYVRYRITDRAGRREVWITDDKAGLPRRIVHFDRQSGGTVRQEYMDWARELELPGSFFEPDPGVEIERLDYEEYMEGRGDDSDKPLLPILIPELFHGRPAS